MAKIKPAAGDMTGQGNIKNSLKPTEKPKTARKAPTGSGIQNNSAKISSDGVVKKPNKTQAAKTVEKKSGSIEAAFKKAASKSQSDVPVDNPVENGQSDIKPAGVDESVFTQDLNSTSDDEWESEEYDEEDDENDKEVADRSIPKPKRDKWKKHDTPDKNGRCVGRQLVMWHRPRMMEKMLLHIQYECQRANIALPWEKIVHRLMPGSSGPSACQHLAKVRKTLLREGHLVPPLIGKLGTAQDSNIRGYMRDTSDGPDRVISWNEDIVDRKESLDDGVVRGSGRYRQVEVEVKRQAKLELEKTLKAGGKKAVVKVLREAAEYRHNPARVHDGNQARREKAEAAKTLASSKETKTDSEVIKVASPTKKHNLRGMSEPDDVSSEFEPVDLDSDADYCPTPTKRARTAVRKSTRARKPVKVEAEPELSEEETTPIAAVKVNTVADSTSVKRSVAKTSPGKLDMAATSEKPANTGSLVKPTMSKSATAVPKTPDKPAMVGISKQPAVIPGSALEIAISATLKKSTPVPETTVKAAIIPATPAKSTATTLKKFIAVSETPSKRTGTVGKKLAVVPTTPIKKQAATVGPRKPKAVKTFIGNMPASVPRKNAPGSDPALAHLIADDVKQPIPTVVLGDEIVDDNKQTNGEQTRGKANYSDFVGQAMADVPFTLFGDDDDDIFAPGVAAAGTSVPPNYTALDHSVSGNLRFPFFNHNGNGASFFGPPEQQFSSVGQFGGDHEPDIFSPTRYAHARFDNYATQSSIAPTTSQVSEQTLVPGNLSFNDNFVGYVEQHSISPSPVIDPHDPIDQFMR